jgi:hypothetical protein
MTFLILRSLLKYWYDFAVICSTCNYNVRAALVVICRCTKKFAFIYALNFAYIMRFNIFY